ncbi:MAG: hypothetical protein ABR961_04550 [Thermoanaerobaculaceae bacterium]
MAKGRRDGSRRKARLEGMFLALGFFSCLFVARRFSTDVAGGSDSYGYVSEAVRSLEHGSTMLVVIVLERGSQSRSGGNPNPQVRVRSGKGTA